MLLLTDRQCEVLLHVFKENMQYCRGTYSVDELEDILALYSRLHKQVEQQNLFYPPSEKTKTSSTLNTSEEAMAYTE